MFVKVAAESAVTTVPEPVGKAKVVLSVPVKVRVLPRVKVFPSAMVIAAEVAGALIVTLLIDVAVATPMVGVTRVGEVAPTTAPEPVVELNAPMVNWPPPAAFVCVCVALTKEAIVGVVSTGDVSVLFVSV